MLAQRGVPLRQQVRVAPVKRPVAKVNLPPVPKAQPKVQLTEKQKRKAAALHAREMLLRRRGQHFQVLTAIAEMLPKDADVNGEARGTLCDKDLASCAGVSGKAVVRALFHWQRWRALWMYRKDHTASDLRFQRAVVEQVLATRAADPSKVAALLIGYKAERERIAPWPRVPRDAQPASDSD